MVPAPAKPAKAAWPLFLLAGLSIVPGLGFLLGSLAAGWGLVSSRPRALVAAGIGAAGALLNVAALILFGFLADRNTPGLAEARLQISRQQLGEVLTALEAFREEEGRYPPSLMVMQRKFGLRRPVPILDPAGGLFSMRPFQYQLAPDGASYDLYSVGRDGQAGTEDDIRPEVPDSMRGRVGLRGGRQ